MQIINTFTGKSITLEIDLSSTVAEVKKLLEVEEGTPCDQQWLLYGQELWDDSLTLSDYNLRQHDTLHMAYRGGFEISVKNNCTGGTTNMFVEPSHTIANIRSHIALTNGCTGTNVRHIFFYSGKLLEEDRTVSDYKIQEHSTILYILQFTEK